MSAKRTVSVRNVKTDLNVECLASHGELRVDEIWRARQVLSTVLLQQHTLQHTTAFGDPHMATLLLVKIIHHDLVFDFVHHG